jgi:hypothetical protein
MELNEKLFKTLEGLEDGSVDIKKAQAIVNVSNAISTNAKLMIQAAKLSKNPNIANAMIGTENAKQLEIKSTYDLKLEFAKKEGFNNLSDAIAKLGKPEFEQQFKDEYQNQD